MTDSLMVMVSDKYHSIPEEDRWFYPDIQDGDSEVKEVDRETELVVGANEELATKPPSLRKKKRAKKHTPGVKPTSTKKQNKLGRPQKEVEVDQSQRTLMDMFQMSANKKAK